MMITRVIYNVGLGQLAKLLSSPLPFFAHTSETLWRCRGKAMEISSSKTGVYRGNNAHINMFYLAHISLVLMRF